jgi:hypothetical protein
MEERDLFLLVKLHCLQKKGVIYHIAVAGMIAKTTFAGSRSSLNRLAKPLLPIAAGSLAL